MATSFQTCLIPKLSKYWFTAFLYAKTKTLGFVTLKSNQIKLSSLSLTLASD